MKYSSGWWTAALLGFLVMLPACDTFQGPTRDRIDVVEVEDLEMTLFGEEVVLYLPDFFEHNKSEDLDYLVETENDILDAEIKRDSLRLIPKTVGTTDVRVEGWDDDGTRSGIDFTVSVTGCPPPAPDGSSIYFPIEEGMRREFDLSSRYRDQMSYRQYVTEMNGDLTWQLKQIQCRREQIDLVFEESFAGTIRTDQTYPDQIQGETRDTSWSTVFVGSITPDSLDLPGYTSSIEQKWPQAFQTSRGMDVDWHYDANSPDTLTFERLFFAGFGSVSLGWIDLVRDHGIVRWQISTSWRGGGYGIVLQKK